MKGKGIDLSKFKKIDEDHKSTTLLHPDGHKIVIAIHGISPKLREELKKLPHEPKMKEALKHLQPEPGYTTPKKMAEGGKASLDNPNTTATTDELVKVPVENAPISQQLPNPANAGPQQPQSAVIPNPPAQAQNEPNPSTESVQIGENPVSSQFANPTDVGPQPQAAEFYQDQAPMTPEQHSANVTTQLLNEDKATGTDIMMGHIKPETMADLFAKRDTLGKIGTLFGLLIGGAGAGLSHQPNALLGMMQKEIDNDLDAQKASATNAQNFYRLQMQQQLQQSEIGLKGAQKSLIEQQIKDLAIKTPAEIAEMHSRGLLNDAQASALTLKTPAEVAHLKAQGRLTDAQAKEIKLTTQPKVNLMRAQAFQTTAQGNLDQAEAAIKSDALSHMLMNRAALKQSTDIVNSKSATPQQRQDAQNQLALLANSIDSNNYDLASVAGAKAAQMRVLMGMGQQQLTPVPQQQQNLPQQQPIGVAPQTMGAYPKQQTQQIPYKPIGAAPQPMGAQPRQQPQQQQPIGAPPQGQNNSQPQVDPEKQFQNYDFWARQSGNEKAADYMEQRHFPSIYGQATKPVQPEDKEYIQSAQDLLGGLNRLKQFAQMNANSPDLRKIQAGQEISTLLTGDFRHFTKGGVYKEGEQNFIDKIIPSDPTALLPSYTVLPKLNALISETQSRYTKRLNNLGFPDQPKMFGGKKYIKGPNGKPVEVK